MNFETIQKILGILLVANLMIRRSNLKTNQERLEFITDAVVTVAIIYM